MLVLAPRLLFVHRSEEAQPTQHTCRKRKTENMSEQKNWMLNDAQNTKMDFKNVPNRPHTWLNGCSTELTTPCHAWKSSIYAYFRKKKKIFAKEIAWIVKAKINAFDRNAWVLLGVYECFFLACSYHSCTTFHQFCYAELVFTAISPNNVIWIKGSANANWRNSDTHPAHPLQWLIDTICNFFFQYLFRFNQSIKIDFETTRMHAKVVDCFGFVFHTHS